MFESTGKWPESYGIYSKIKTHSTGLFDECLAIHSNSIQGKYCTAIFTTEPVQSNEILFKNISKPFNYGNWIAQNQLPWIFKHLSIGYYTALLKEPKYRPMLDTSGSQFSILQQPSVGYCIPSSCSGNDFATAVAQQVGQTAVGNVSVGGIFHYTSIVTNAGDPYCFTAQQMGGYLKNFDGPDITMMYIGSNQLLQSVP